jgi:hypothetical protein
MISPNRRWLGGFVLAVALLKAAPLSAQTFEVGVNGQLAAVIVEDDDGGMFASAGVDVCAKCSDRFGCFAEYSHWARPQPLRSATRVLPGMDLGGGGLRIHGRNPSGGVRGFFDVGLGGGQYRLLQPPGENTFFGVILGAGAIVPLGDRWYVRPQFRGYWMGIYSLTLSGGIGVGIRL